MISNRNSLEKEVTKKRQQQSLLKQNKEKQRKMIAYSIISGLALLLICYAAFNFSSSPKKKQAIDFQTPQSGTDKYNSKLEALETKNSSKKQNSSLIDVFSNKKKDTITAQAEKGLEESIKAYKEKPTTPKRNRKAKRSYSTEKTTDQNRKIQELMEKVARLEQEKKEQKQDPIPEDPQPIKAKHPYDFDALPPLEKRRLILRLGKPTYKASSEIKAKLSTWGKVRAGSTVRITTEQEAYLNLEILPRGTSISGVVSFEKGRMHLKFSRVVVNGKVMKIDLDLHDIDGMRGLLVADDEFWEEQKEEGADQITRRTGVVGAVIGDVLQSKRRKKAKEVTLGQHVYCILLNNNPY